MLWPQVGIAIFSLVIAAHNFNLLFLYRQWSNRTSYIVVIASWATIIFDICIGYFALAKPEKGPYYGIAGYWCWITPVYPTERLTTEYLFMFVSAGSSFILYLLVFFRLRGNITLSTGYKFEFHHSPGTRVSRTNDGSYVVTDNRDLESHFTVVARHMLKHPIAYIVLVLPTAASRFSAFSGTSVPFPIVIMAASLFVLTGFINVVLFRTTRNILPGGWREIFSLRSMLGCGRGDTRPPSRSPTRRPTKSGARKGGFNPGRASVTTLGGDIEIVHQESMPRHSTFELGTPTSITWPPRAYGGVQRAEKDSYDTRYISFLPPLHERTSVHVRPVGEEGGDLSEDIYLANYRKESDATIFRHPAPPWRECGTPIGQSALAVEASALDYPFATVPPIDTDTRRAQSSSVVTPEIALNQTRFSGVSRDSRGDSSSMHWEVYNRQSPQNTDIDPFGSNSILTLPCTPIPNQDVLDIDCI